MRRLLLTVALATGLLFGPATAEAATPPGLTYGSWHKARVNRNPIQVCGPIPNQDRYTDQQIINAWNMVALWEMFRLNNGAFRNCDIEFRWAWNFGIGPNNCDCLAAWVQHFWSDPGYYQNLSKVIIWLNPRVPSWQISTLMIQHELGHALGFGGDTDCNNPYRGVMSYCDFWGNGWMTWWGVDDAYMLFYAGYR